MELGLVQPARWQHPVITVDQNQLRNPEAVSRVAQECRRSGLGILLPDGAFLEFSKSGFPFETAKRSLQGLAPHNDLVRAGRKLTEMMLLEFQDRRPCSTLVSEKATAYLRSTLTELWRGDETPLRQLFEGRFAELISPALSVWNDHEGSKRLVQGLHDQVKNIISADQLNAIRQSPADGVSRWLSSLDAMRIALQWLKQLGADDYLAYELTRSPSVNAAFISSLVGLAAYWLAFGGLGSAPAAESSADLHDAEYVALGALSRSLATSDKRATIICAGVARAIEARQSLPQPAA